MDATYLCTGPAFRKIDRLGHVAKESLSLNSLIPIPRKLFAAAALDDAH